MFVLQLNDMRFGNIETLEPVARAETAEALEKFMERETVEGYRDDNWGKGYRSGGPLEWCNKPFDLDRSIFHVGTLEEWTTNAIAQYNAQVMTLHSAD